MVSIKGLTQTVVSALVAAPAMSAPTELAVNTTSKHSTPFAMAFQHPTNNQLAPTRFGLLLFPSITAIDAFGPLEFLALHSMGHYLNLSVIAQTLDPVSSKPRAMNAAGSSFGTTLVPTHTFANPPALDVLIIPGGIGTRAPDLDPAIAYVKATYPSLQYLITVCTGAGIAARAGVLDGKFATTNKRAWAETTGLRKEVKWVGKARWIADGNVWTASGVAAGMDLMNAFMGYVWGEALAKIISDGMEYTPSRDPRVDPYAELNNVTSVYDEMVGANGRVVGGV
ncbi:ThiJ/PfpI family protein [Amylocarpus encephaloides]|uniref:ThiJ/PfpI family protein n=1 Tax=Amylocarpus encephaloides TaxID=45428 RepID=A0A9P7YLG5_9HELO|nr:ThiJ/PfpI family protein [Amylocarpus encephaloides]